MSDFDNWLNGTTTKTKKKETNTSFDSWLNGTPTETQPTEQAETTQPTISPTVMKGLQKISALQNLPTKQATTQPTVTQPTNSRYNVVQTPTQPTPSTAAPQKRFIINEPQETPREELTRTLSEKGLGQNEINTVLSKLTDEQVNTFLQDTKKTATDRAMDMPASPEKTTIERVGNAVMDTGYTLGSAATSGVARLADAAKMGVDYLSLNDSTFVDAEDLYNYANGGRTDKDKVAMKFLFAVSSARPNDTKIQTLYNEIKNGTYKGTKEDIQKELDDSQALYHDMFYYKWIYPWYVARFENQKEQNKINHSEAGANLLNMAGDITEATAPTLVAGTVAAAPASMGIAGAISGQKKMEQYREAGKSYSEAAAEVPIETAKGVTFGAILQLAKPIMASGMIKNPSTLAEAGKNILRAFINGLGVGSVGALTTQQLDWLKADPNYDYMNWDNINQGIQEGKYKNLNDYINSSDYTKDVATNRLWQIGIAGLVTGGFNVLSTAPGTKRAIQQTIAKGKYDPTNDLKMLGLEKGATEEEINKAYRLWALKNRPDLGGVSSETNQEMTDAVARLRAYKQGTMPKFVNNLKDWFSSEQTTANTQGAVATEQALVPYQGDTTLSEQVNPQTITQEIVPMSPATAQPAQPSQLTDAKSVVSAIAKAQSLSEVTDIVEAALADPLIDITDWQEGLLEESAKLEEQAKPYAYKIQKNEQLVPQEQAEYDKIVETAKQLAEKTKWISKTLSHEIADEMKAREENTAGQQPLETSKGIDITPEKEMLPTTDELKQAQTQKSQTEQQAISEAAKALNLGGNEPPSEPPAPEKKASGATPPPDDTDNDATKPTKKTTLNDIVDMKPEDVKLTEMNYKQKNDKDTANHRKFFDNAESSDIVDKETKNRVKQTTYDVKKNETTLDTVSKELDERGNEMIEEWKLKKKNFTDKDVALGAILVERYQQAGDWESAARTVEKLADMGTEAGRAVQMYSIFQRLTPETMAIYQQKTLDKAFEESKKKKTGKWVEQNQDQFKLTDEDTKFIYEQVEKAQQAIDEETKQRELSKIENRINDKLPPESGDATRTLRRIAMLLNPKTHCW